MSLLQHYYTSCPRGLGGGAGFQTKAQSIELSATDLQTINSMIGYRIPTSLDERAVSSHPIALRYDYINKDKCILACSQSNGQDQNGRPGNFFAHSIVTSPADFDIFPPIMFWRSPFWKTSDDSSQLEIPAQPGFEVEPSLQFEGLWPFLEAENRREWFCKLLSAVLRYDQTKRPIVILDQIDNIASWIACVTIALPQIYRNYLTFATYHHDPYQVPYIITGTTADSKFRFTADEYITYFVINAEQNHISDVDECRYARFVCDNLTPDLYETKLTDFFEMCNHRLPNRQPANLNAVLEAVTDAYVTLRDRKLSVSTDNARRGLQSFISYIESQTALSAEDLEDLRTAVDLLGAEMATNPTPAIVQEYSRALLLLKKYDQSFQDQVQSDVRFVTKLLLQGKEEISQTLLKLYQDIYQIEPLRRVISQPDYLEALGGKLKENPAVDVHILVWKYLAPLAKFDARTEPALAGIFHASLAALEKFPSEALTSPPEDAARLIDAILNSMNSNLRFVLKQGLEYQTQHSGQVYLWLYYRLVEHHTLAERARYRDIIISEYPDVIVYEILRDVQMHGATQLVPVLLEWLDYLGEAMAKQNLVNKIFSFFWPHQTPDQQQAIAKSTLLERRIYTLLGDAEKGPLVAAYFSTVQLERIDPRFTTIYRENLSNPALSADQQAIIGGALAMSTGEFPKKTVPALKNTLESYSEKKYQTEAEKLIHRFYDTPITVESHMDMLQATYVWRHEALFWELYWHYFKQVFMDLERVRDTATILKFWLDDAPAAFAKDRYLSQTFLLELPAILKELEKERDFERVINWLKQITQNDAWFQLLSHHILTSKKAGFFGFLK